jgi:hypothetical protein
MMESSREAKSVRLPVFDGAYKNFQVWWTRFMAYAAVYKFAQALTIGGEAAMPATEATSINPTTATGKEQEAAKRRNAVAIANLTMAFTSEATMSLVYKAMKTDWPSGLAHLVVEALFKEYQPQDTITRVELRQMLNGVKMKKGEGPATLFQQISSIENKYNTATKQIDEEDLIAVVLDAAPMEYQAILTSEQRRRGTI